MVTARADKSDNVALFSAEGLNTHMNVEFRGARFLSAVGAVAFVVGAVDPLEGSVVVLVGSALLLAGEILRVGERRRLALWTSVFVLTAVGVAMMFFLSSLGGLGGDRGKSWWWGLLILPYPAGWLLGVGALVARGVRRARFR